MRSVLQEAIMEMLETSLFAFGESDDGAQPAADGCEATVRFHGAAEGALVLRVDRSLAKNFAGFFVGAEPEDVDDDLTRGTVGELANILAGAILPAVSERIVDLDPPTVRAVVSVPPPANDGETVVRVRTDGGVLVARFQKAA